MVVCSRVLLYYSRVVMRQIVAWSDEELEDTEWPLERDVVGKKM